MSQELRNVFSLKKSLNNHQTETPQNEEQLLLINVFRKEAGEHFCPAAPIRSHKLDWLEGHS